MACSIASLSDKTLFLREHLGGKQNEQGTPENNQL